MNKITTDQIEFSPFSNLDVFIKGLARLNGNPSGSWADPVSVNHKALSTIRDLDRAGEYTLNKQIRHLSGKEQMGRLQILLNRYGHPDNDYGSAVHALMSATKLGYILPDLRCAEYIWHNYRKARKINPRLFRYLKDFGTNWFLYFTGSTVRDENGYSGFPCINFYSDAFMAFNALHNRFVEPFWRNRYSAGFNLALLVMKP